MNVLVFGAGAVGAYLGARLARAGHEVTLLARPAWAEAIRERGLVLEEALGPTTIRPARVLSRLPESLALPADGIILLTVKAYDCAAAAAEIRDRVRGSGPVLCLLNGIGNEETLERVLGAGRVVGASLTTAVSAVSPGVLRLERERGLALERTAAAAPLAQALLEAGIRTRIYADRGSIKWSKLPTNLMANASSAILGWSAGQAMAHPGVYRIEVEAAREAFRVMRGLRHRPVNLPGVPVRWLAYGVGLPLWISHPWLRRIVSRGRGGKRPSFHFDIGRGRSEAPWLHGPVVQHGRQLGIPTPANELLLETLMALVEGSADPAVWRDRPSALTDLARHYGVPGFARPLRGGPSSSL